MSELQLIYDKLDRACYPEEVFGLDLKTSFRALVKACHPDNHPSDLVLAQKVSAKLNELKAEADIRVKSGTWGKKIPLSHCKAIKVGMYTVSGKPKIGDICDLYLVEGKDLLVKVARNHGDNDLLRAETNALKALKAGIKGPVSKGVPSLVEVIHIDGIWKKQANVIEYFPGFVTALEVRQKMTIDARTSVWMFKRLLSLLSWSHHLGLLHGAILPSHVLFYPDNDGKKSIDERKHSLRLIDWCYSVNFEDRTRLSSWVSAWKDHYAPELINKKYIGPASDIYMGAKLITYLCGLLPKRLQTVIDKCLEKDYRKRPQKAEDVFEDWKNAAKLEFGSPTWHNFNLP